MNRPSTPPDADDRLWRWLQSYCSFGDHRTGTVVDRRTTDWLMGELESLGGTVERLPFAFDRYDGTALVTIDGHSVPAEALPYEGVGSVVSDRPHTAVVEALGGDRVSAALDEAIAAAHRDGADALVIATEHRLGELAMPNRAPVVGSGLPVALVAGRHGPALTGRSVRLEFHGEVASGESANVLATFGHQTPSRRPLVLATPLTGWFSCATERASGIAVLLSLVSRLAARHPLLVVGASGHELLPHLGLERFLAERSVDADLVVHLGANVAASGDGIVRGLFARLDDHRLGAVGVALAGVGVTIQRDPPRWFGEGALWAAASDAPLLSFVGGSPVFHTPADVPGAATDPATLRQVADAVGDALEACLDVAAGGAP